MSTNYYLERLPLCDTHPDCLSSVELARACFAERLAACPMAHQHASGRELERLFIGKSAAGWAFGLHVGDERKSLDDWKALFALPQWRIVDEYGEEHTAADMLACITERRGPDNPPPPSLLARNGAWWDPSCNLLRRSPRQQFARADEEITNAQGTYDLVPGSWS